ncbi:MAG: carboxypeptidase regulatory-like domain-containing protein [Chlamydiia bacterium]|nr:carboxypeptidase regulatory-like domain-containing protein [Chlamydiia bacterium]
MKIKNFTFILLISIVTSFYSCDKASSDVKFSGTIVNSTDIQVPYTLIRLFDIETEELLYTINTGANGDFSLSEITKGIYKVVFSADGYESNVMELEIGENTLLDVLLLGAANISGQIINSQDGYGLKQSIISFFSVDARGNEYLAMQVITDENGYYIINNSPIGEFTRIVEHNGFFRNESDLIDIIKGINDVYNQIILVEQPEEGEYRIVLSWGALPEDLDSHLTGPRDGDDRFHVYYSNRTESNSEENPDSGIDVDLDVDDVTSYGPETITIHKWNDGMYRYSIHNYTNQETDGGDWIFKSPAIVEVYDHNGLVKHFEAPSFTGNGNTWRVFEMIVNGENIIINDINTYVQAESDDDVSIFGKKSKKNLLFNINDF